MAKYLNVNKQKRFTMASLDLMIDLQNFVVTISAVSGLISHTHEKANRSTPPRSEQRLEDNNSGNMSILRSVRYTVVHLQNDEETKLEQ